MSWVAAAVAGTALVGSVVQSNAAGRASSRAANATDAANQLQAEQFYQTREDNLPLMDLRNALLPRIKALAQQDVSISLPEVLSDPGYQFGLDERQRVMKNNAAAGGGLYSGRTLKALGRDAQDYGMTRYGDLLNRKETTLTNALNRSSAAAGLGQAGVLQTQQAGSTYAANVGNNLLSNANFQGAAGIAGANAWGNALNRGSSYLPTSGGRVGQSSNMLTNKGYFSNLSNGYSNDDVYWN